ncbi:MAG TPA: enoyl-CoA hydratase [Solirubrobacteraceae bacterium]|nr:enoyl-CoA hydratase [Solirubrobacteraceae bacterium]
MSDLVVLKDVRDDGVAVLTLNRPDRLNAWTSEVEHQYFGALRECAASEDVRVIVVTGAGRGFCAGADMQSLQGIEAAVSGAAGTNGSSNGASAGAEDVQAAREQIPQTFTLSVPKPVIAAINGPCAGIGLVLALMCDVRFVAENAKLTTAFSRRGLVAEHGISWILPRLLGPARALDLLLSGRVVLGREAVELGLCNRVTPPETVLEETLAYAHELATLCSPASMAAMKRQVYAALAEPLAEATAEADRLMLASFAQPDFAEGVASFVERREPNFAPLAS